MPRLHTSLFLSLLTLVGLSAFGAEGDGGAAAYRQLGVGARALGQGGAVTASVQDATAAYWNPAGLSHLEKSEVVGMHANLDLDRNFNYLAVAMPSDERGAWAFSYTRFSVGSIPETRVDAAGNPIEVDGDATVGNSPVRVFSLFEDTEENVTLGYSREVTDKMRVGANLRYLRQTLFDATANGIGLDLGMMYSASERLSLGLSLRDLAETIAWNGGSGARDKVSTTSSLGVAYRPRNDLNLNLDLAKTGQARGVVRLGAEKWWQEKYAFRLGANDGDLTAGASLRFEDWDFDYAFAAGDLGDIQRISFSRRF